MRLGRATDGLATGRSAAGRVDYEYSIGRFEVTTAQWTEFFNAAFDRPESDRIPHVFPPQAWGAVPATPSTPGGLRWTVPAGREMRPVGGITWRTAAIYTNWLNSGKRTDREAFLSGAYDVSTFGFDANFRFTDQQTHTPGARYWIPKWDEMIKASHWDPNRFGDGQPGYWLYNYKSDAFPRWGPPGVGDGNFGSAGSGGRSPYTTALGAYGPIASPWGLFDNVGATSEWTEEVIGGSMLERLLEGSFWDSATGQGAADSIYAPSSEFPHIDSLEYGLRIASSVPGTECAGLLLLWFLAVGRRRGVVIAHMRRPVTSCLLAMLMVAVTTARLPAQPIVVEWRHGADPVVRTLHAAGADITISLDGDPSTPGAEPLVADTLIRIFEAGTSSTTLS
jgi:formylglycine-generating enzyme required for sulfatase activity